MIFFRQKSILLFVIRGRELNKPERVQSNSLFIEAPCRKRKSV
jgi:hypothetical protein